MPPNSGSEKNNRRKLGVSGPYYGSKLLSPVFNFGSKISRVSVSKDPAHEKMHPENFRSETTFLTSQYLTDYNDNE